MRAGFGRLNARDQMADPPMTQPAGVFDARAVDTPVLVLDEIVRNR
jgi:hypothetical protein